MQSFDFRLVEAGEFTLPAIVRGPAEGTVVLLVPPLFEEMNRCRRLLADLGRALGDRDIATLLPDLPGTGDCIEPAATVTSWRTAIEALTLAFAADRPTYVFTIRGGALLSDGRGALGIYRFAAVSSGTILLREMMRAQAIADQEHSGGNVAPSAYERRLAAGEPLEITGYAFAPKLAFDLAALVLSEPSATCRTADLKPGGDAQFEGPPVWRQAEPVATRALAAALAEDIAAWIR